MSLQLFDVFVSPVTFRVRDETRRCGVINGAYLLVSLGTLHAE
jgi:hypothetical protein